MRVIESRSARAWYNGSTSASQAEDEGSIPFARTRDTFGLVRGGYPRVAHQRLAPNNGARRVLNRSDSLRPHQRCIWIDVSRVFSRRAPKKKGSFELLFIFYGRTIFNCLFNKHQGSYNYGK